jgi:putative ABC transport system ATP-binding protein
MADQLLVAQGVVRTYGEGASAVRALRGVDLDVAEGELLAIRGRSGSGKTTLLNLLGGLDAADGGRIVVADQEVTAMDGAGLARLRRDVVSYVFQSFGLLPMLSAAENIGVPLRLRKVPAAEREQRAHALLTLVGLEGHANHLPGELSGGQQQRVAIARALANAPKLLLADEPTGQLDSQTAQLIMALLSGVVRSEGVTAVVATHDPALLDIADRVLELRDGRLAA